MSSPPVMGDHFRLLLRLDRTRLTSLLRRPAPALLAAVALPLLVLASALWLLGRVSGSGVEGLYRGITLGLFVSGAVAFVAYGVLFGGSDDGFLRRLGIHPRALFLERCARLTAASAGIVLALLLPAIASRFEAGEAMVAGAGVALASVGTAALCLAWAARATVTGGARWLRLGVSAFDPELQRAAALVYAPMPSFLVGSAVGVALGSGLLSWRVAAVTLAVALAFLGVLLGARIFDSASPRYLPYAREIAYVPPARGGEAFRVGRGFSALLPRRAAAVWVRDATVAARRFPWATRVAWPVTIASILALARWGDEAATRVWVIVAVGAALLVQGAAIVALGRVERVGTRWLDRSAGLGAWERFLGRWTWGWGLSLWLLIPVALAWYWWSGRPGAAYWVLAGGFSAAIAASASLLQAERRR